MDRRSYKVNINRASADELFRGIPGIRRDKIDYIIRNRPFRSWDEMQMVPGLSPEMIDTLKITPLSTKNIIDKTSVYGMLILKFYPGLHLFPDKNVKKLLNKLIL
jgi:hypothetical protein